MQAPEINERRSQLNRVLMDPNSFGSILPKDVRELILNLVIGRAYVFGNSKNNKFGDINGDQVLVPIELKMNIRDLAFGDGYTLVLTMSGELYAAGEISVNSMGLTLEEKDHLHSIYSDIISRDSGEYDGQMLVSITKFLNITLIKEFKQKIVKICSGMSHTLILTDTGNCYSFGDNRYGQLGTDDVKAEDQWNHIASNVIDIGCGTYHSGYLTQTHQLYLFGSNMVRQLAGITTEDQLYHPTLYDVPDKIEKIFIQYINTCYIANGYLYCCGMNMANKFGLPKFIAYINTPIRIVDEFDQPLINVDKITIDFEHVLILANNNLYIGGSNSMNVLGLGDIKKIDRIQLMEQFADGKVTDIAVNPSSSVIIHDKIGYYTDQTTTRFTPMPMFTKSFIKSYTDIRVVGGYDSYGFLII